MVVKASQAFFFFCTHGGDCSCQLLFIAGCAPGKADEKKGGLCRNFSKEEYAAMPVHRSRPRAVDLGLDPHDYALLCVWDDSATRVLPCFDVYNLCDIAVHDLRGV